MKYIIICISLVVLFVGCIAYQPTSILGPIAQFVHNLGTTTVAPIAQFIHDLTSTTTISNQMDDNKCGTTTLDPMAQFIHDLTSTTTIAPPTTTTPQPATTTNQPTTTTLLSTPTKPTKATKASKKPKTTTTPTAATSTDKVVSTIYRPVQGSLRVGEKSGNYYGFQGIRFAEPPVGDLRFKDPVFPQPSNETFDATQEGPSCYGSGMFIINTTIASSEDCLRINVFSKTLGPNQKAPVMVFIYGGCYIAGSSEEILYGPDLLLQKNVVVVTFNYRLGVFGFLSNSDPTYNTPGNAGLKDQSFALQWVHSNILNFGGDPDNVTLFGESAGAASVHFHMISNYSKNLFHRAICESGSVFSPWATQIKGDFNERIARNLGWTDADGPDALMTTLMTATATDLSTYQNNITPAEMQGAKCSAFVPTIEPYDNGQSFIPTDVASMTKSAWSKNIPLLIGSNSAEGYVILGLYLEAGNFLTDPDVFQNLLPSQIDLPLNSPERIALADSLRQFYFGDGTLTLDTLDMAALLISDKLFWQAQSAVSRTRVAVGSAPTYLYRFDFGSTVLTYIKLLYAGKYVPGAVHAEELLYLWSIAGINTGVPPLTVEGHVMDYMVEVWTQFAATGNPVTTLTPGWLPVAPGNATLKCINFNVTNTFIDLPETNGIAFWDSLWPVINL